MRALESIIFDLDGTLWNTVEVCAKAWNQTLAREKGTYRKIRPEDIAQIMGLTSDEVRADIFFDLNPLKGSRLLELCFQNEVRHIIQKQDLLYPGVKNGIRELAADFSLYIVSNCDRPYLDAFFESTDLKPYFKDWECHGNSGLFKGENIQRIIDQNHPRSTIYIGDTLGDLKASRQTKIPFGYVEYGFGKCHDFELRFQTFNQVVAEMLKMRKIFHPT